MEAIYSIVYNGHELDPESITLLLAILPGAIRYPSCRYQSCLSQRSRVLHHLFVTHIVRQSHQECVLVVTRVYNTPISPHQRVRSQLSAHCLIRAA